MDQIEFQIEGFGRDEVQAFEALIEGIALVEPDRLWGSLIFNGDDGKSLAIKEDLAYLMFAICVEVPKQLQQSGQAVLKMQSWRGEFFFQPDATGLKIRITGPTKVSTSFLKEIFLEQLNACGKRFANFVSELAVNEAHWSELAEKLRMNLREQAPLNSWDLPS